MTFHEGGTFEPSDIAYSIQRGLLQDRVDGPQWLLMEPLLGIELDSDGLRARRDQHGLAEGVEGPTLADVPNDVLVEIWTRFKVAIAGDDEAGTVTIDVLQSTPWMLQLLAQTWGWRSTRSGWWSRAIGTATAPS